TLVLDGNPLTTLVLSEPLATTNLAGTVSQLQNRGVNVFTYPLAPRLIRPRTLIGAFLFAIDGPPGAYAVLASTNLATWVQLSVVTNSLGKVNFVDGQAHLFPRRFYRVQLQSPPTNMVLIPANTFN